MIDRLAWFADASHLMVCVTISTLALLVALAADRIFPKRVLTVDAVWSAALAFLLLCPAAILMLPNGLAQNLAPRFRSGKATTGFIAGAPQQDAAIDVARSRLPHTRTKAGSPTQQISALTRNLADPGERPVAATFVALLAAAGSGAMLIKLGANHVRCRKLLRSAPHCQSVEWLESLERRRTALGIRRPISLRISPSVSSPLTAGWRHPIIVLPESIAASACPSTREAIVLHETTHIARGDYVVHLAWLACQRLYWWNPLVWLAARRVSTLREIVCDSYCVSTLDDRQAYISALLDIGRRIIEARDSKTAVAMARSSNLAERLCGIDTHRVLTPRARWTTRWGFSLIALTAATLVAATNAAEPAPKADSNDKPAKVSEPNSKVSRYSFSAATSAANPTEAQQKLAREGYAKQRQLCSELSKDPQFQLGPDETLRFLPKGTRSDALAQLRQLLSDGDRNAWIQFYAPGLGDEVKASGWTYDDDRTVADVLNSICGVRLHQLLFDKQEDREKLLKTVLLGDWVFLDDPQMHRTPNQRELNVVAEAISKQIRGRCRLRLTRAYAPVYVATGDYKFQPLPASIGKASPLSGKVAKLAEGEFWIPLRRTKYAGTVVQSFEDFLAVWSEVLLTPIVDQVNRRPINDAFFIKFSSDSVVPLMKPLSADQEKQIVQHFCDQTGLKLTKSQRQTLVVRVVAPDTQ